MSAAVLIPTQRIHERLPRSPHENAHASSSRAASSATYPTPSSSTSPRARPASRRPSSRSPKPEDDDDEDQDFRTIDDADGLTASPSVKGKGRARSTPSTPSSSGPGRFLCTHAPDQCSRSFNKRGKLEEHMLTHTGQRPHACPHCPLSFTRPTHLQAHVRTHLPETDKPFACSKTDCTKRFWTAQHLRRHEDGCGEGRYQCTVCPASFSLSHQLRSHQALDHSPPGTKPFPCTEPDCDKSFPTSQKLRQHAKMHDDSRYLCTHPSHPPEGLSFSTWTSLRAHVSTAHPPTCPYAECAGRAPFKSKKGLKAHLKVHKEQEEDDALLGPDEDEPRGRARKRSRSEDGGSDAEEKADGVQRKKRRRSVSVAGKDWVCEVEGCGKAFKSNKARKTHHQTSHLQLRPFICPHRDSDGCEATYGHNHLLQRHLHKAHPGSSHATIAAPPPKVPASTEATADEMVGFLTGSTYVSERKIACPFHGRAGTLVSAEAQGGGADEGCGFRFSRAYDLRRHLGKEHGVVVSEEESKGMAEGLRGRAG